MTFRPIRLDHGERLRWSRVTHVRLTGRKADTEQGQQVLDHIAVRADDQGIATIAQIEPDFPARKKHLGARRGMEIDLRYMANRRDAGIHEENKGLIELGWME